MCDCVEELRVPLLFETKRCAASLTVYGSEDWVLGAVRQFDEGSGTGFYISFSTCLLHAWRLHVLPVWLWEDEPNSLSSSLMLH